MAKFSEILVEIADLEANELYQEACKIGASDINSEIEKYKEVIIKNPNHFSAKLKLAQLYYDTKKFDSAIELYENKNLWNSAQENGFKILKDHFDKELFEKEFEAKLKYLQYNLTQIRNQNFIGQILKSNAANALKYMSLWIEEKNKSKK